MVNGCQNTTKKLIVENKIETKFLQKDNRILSDNFSKNKIIKSEIVSNIKKKPKKPKKNNVIFEFRNERLLQGRDETKSTEKMKTKKALSAVFKMLKQNLSLDNNNLNLKNSGEISLENTYFDLKKQANFYKNIIVILVNIYTLYCCYF